MQTPKHCRAVMFSVGRGLASVRHDRLEHAGLAHVAQQFEARKRSFANILSSM